MKLWVSGRKVRAREGLMRDGPRIACLCEDKHDPGERNLSCVREGRVAGVVSVFEIN